MQVPKACCIKICKGLKFGLVHKFPSDLEKYNEWIQIIETKAGGLPDKMKDLSQEQIKKRFFICCRHFGISSYKNVESRSLNITSNPHLNLLDLNDYALSKAHQLESSSTPEPNPSPEKSQSPKKIQATVIELPKFKILNPEASLSSAPPRKIVRVKQENEGHVAMHVRSQKRLHQPQELQHLSPSPKVIKLQDILEDFSDALDPAETKFEIIEKSSPAKDSTIIEEIILPPNPPQNKLLALFEVTPEQYQSLSQNLKSSERSSKIESLVTTFLDKEENVNDTSIDNGEHANKF